MTIKNFTTSYPESNSIEGYMIFYTKEDSVIHIVRGNSVEVISGSSNRRRFRKVLRKIAKGTCPVCKTDSTVTAEVTQENSLVLWCSCCNAQACAKNIWLNSVRDQAEAGIQNKDGNRKALQNFVSAAKVDKSAKMLHGKCHSIT